MQPVRTKRVGTASAPKAKKRRVAYATFAKWKTDMDKDCQTVTWLACDKEFQAGKKYVTKLRCSVCTKLKTKIMGRRNFSEAWITGAESIRNSNIRNHARSEQHKRAMNFLKRERAAATNAQATSYKVQSIIINAQLGAMAKSTKIRYDANKWYTRGK